ncbi:Tyrosyl-tRNA synthetase, class Ib, bacterial/mitochondrial, partial [Prunus dulcis]
GVMKMINVNKMTAAGCRVKIWIADLMSLEEKYQMVRSVAEECIQDYERRNFLAHKPEPICYDGFEPSGRMHIAQ